MIGSFGSECEVVIIEGWSDATGPMTRSGLEGHVFEERRMEVGGGDSNKGSTLMVHVLTGGLGNQIFSRIGTVYHPLSLE